MAKAHIAKHMIFPTNETKKSLTCKGCPAGTYKFSNGVNTPKTSTKLKNASHAMGLSNAGLGGTVMLLISSLCTSALHRKQTLRSFLNEYDDDHQDRNLGKHGSCPTF
jgi:hypothetical protein